MVVGIEVGKLSKTLAQFVEGIVVVEGEVGEARFSGVCDIECRGRVELRLEWLLMVGS